MRSSRLMKYKRKYKKAVIALQILAIWYAVVFSAALLTSPTGAYFNDTAVAFTTIPIGEWEADEKDSSSLVFPNENNDQNIKTCEPEEIQVKLKNGGGEMQATSTYEVYYAVKGNPKKGERLELEADEGTIEKLKEGEEVELIFLAEEPGNYKFKAYQVEGHKGSGELWSETITIECQQQNKSETGNEKQAEEKTAEEQTEQNDQATEEKDNKQPDVNKDDGQTTDENQQESDKATDEKQEESNEKEEQQTDKEKQPEAKAANTETEATNLQAENTKDEEASESKEKGEGDKE
ncbi:amyloid fiber anchoring/assembly protein TapA [Virgibacillus senegalensis]|uniref:amyloid fiber anchoring/assembly protein TapA n=1 Tax=Virgibacillus senegalensis TaxID=1499679 RepID=UPI00069DEE65|nr:amyloid fiber anchoring/assembly protein TapA [Virgibacillus senegalensis]